MHRKRRIKELSMRRVVIIALHKKYFSKTIHIVMNHLRFLHIVVLLNAQHLDHILCFIQHEMTLHNKLYNFNYHSVLLQNGNEKTVKEGYILLLYQLTLC